MIKILPDMDAIYSARGLNLVYRSIIQQQLSSTLRESAYSLLQSVKGWVSGFNLTNDVDNQIYYNKLTKILEMEYADRKIRIHCICKYSWRSILRWQYSYDRKASIWVLNKHKKANADYLLIFNKQMNQAILISKEEVDKIEPEKLPILNKFNGKTKQEDVYKIPYYENSNIEYYSKDSNTSSWLKRKLDGSPL